MVVFSLVSIPELRNEEKPRLELSQPGYFSTEDNGGNGESLFRSLFSLFASVKSHRSPHQLDLARSLLLGEERAVKTQDEELTLVRLWIRLMNVYQNCTPTLNQT